VAMDRLDIVAGVIFNENRSQVLIAKRPEKAHQGGLWEFPGGKLEQGETPTFALKRELHEELDLIILDCTHFITLEHDYSDVSIGLEVWTVDRWEGDVYGKEGQTIEWVERDKLSDRDFPAANIPIIELLVTEV